MSEITTEDLEDIVREEASVRRPDGSTVTLADLIASNQQTSENA
ncbi:hypothetical protein [Natrinema sp. CGMCC1.2065]